MQKSFCDKCRAEMALGTRKNASIGLWLHVVDDKREYGGEKEEYDTYKVFKYDLCDDCANKVIEFITGSRMDNMIN